MMGGGAESVPPIFICENNRKSNKIMYCVEKVLKIRPFFTKFWRQIDSLSEKIVKNMGLPSQPALKKQNNSTQCIILSLFLLFSKKKKKIQFKDFYEFI